MTTTSRPAAPLAPARLRPSDLAGLASVGLRTRKLRALLSANLELFDCALVELSGLPQARVSALLHDPLSRTR